MGEMYLLLIKCTRAVDLSDGEVQLKVAHFKEAMRFDEASLGSSPAASTSVVPSALNP